MSSDRNRHSQPDLGPYVRPATVACTYAVNAQRLADCEPPPFAISPSPQTPSVAPARSLGLVSGASQEGYATRDRRAARSDVFFGVGGAGRRVATVGRGAARRGDFEARVRIRSGAAAISVQRQRERERGSVSTRPVPALGRQLDRSAAVSSHAPSPRSFVRRRAAPRRLQCFAAASRPAPFRRVVLATGGDARAGRPASQRPRIAFGGRGVRVRPRLRCAVRRRCDALDGDAALFQKVRLSGDCTRRRVSGYANGQSDRCVAAIRTRRP